MYSNKTTRDITVIHGVWQYVLRLETLMHYMHVCVYVWMYMCHWSVFQKTSIKMHRQVLYNMWCKHQASCVAQSQRALSIYQWTKKQLVRTCTLCSCMCVHYYYWKVPKHEHHLNGTPAHCTPACVQCILQICDLTCGKSAWNIRGCIFSVEIANICAYIVTIYVKITGNKDYIDIFEKEVCVMRNTLKNNSSICFWVYTKMFLAALKLRYYIHINI